jgi:predicted nucleotidyltransferase
MSLSTHSRINNHPTPYAELNIVLHELVARVSDVLGDNLIGAYLQGSFAVGDFDAYSDVDFVVVIGADISDSLTPTLQRLHRDVFELGSVWAQHLEGSYIPKDALRLLPPPQRRFLYLDHGSRELVRSDHDDSLVVYWVLRERAVTLIGSEPRSLVAPISKDVLSREILETMRTWREQLLATPGKLDSRWYQTFAVLSYCRMLHTLQTGTVESKSAGAAWAKVTLDRRWEPLIQRAWDDRPGDPAWKVRQRADPRDLESTWEFMRYAVDLGRDWRGANSS